MTRKGESGGEYMVYEDTGCAHYPRCLECPAPCCVYDDIKRFYNWRRSQKRESKRIAKWGSAMTKRQQALTYATEHGVSMRTAQRRLWGQ